MKPSDLGLFFTGRFLITYSISLLVIGLFIFSIISWFSLGKLHVSKNFFISFRLSSLLIYSCLWQPLMILWISVVSVVMPPFSFIILLICVLSLFSSVSLAKGLSILPICSKNLLWLIFAIAFLFSISIIYTLIFSISFFLLNLGSVFSSFWTL